MDCKGEVATTEHLPGRLACQNSFDSPVSHTLKLALNYALQLRRADGHWCGEIRSNPTITAEYVFLRQTLGLDLTADRDALCQWFLSEQRPDGSWSIAPDYPGDVSTTTETYLALKILGYPAGDPVMCRARDFVLSVGGVAKVRMFTRIYLATFGLFPWDAVPQLPPELVLLPPQTIINIYSLACWARSTMMPLLIVGHHQIVYSLPNGKSAANDFLDELWCHPAKKMVSFAPSLWELWKTDGIAFSFAAVDKILYSLGGLRKFPLRSYARQKCIDWILEHQEDCGDWAGYFPPIHGSILALILEGFSLDDPLVRRGLEAAERFVWQDKGGKRVQACVSPVWDTILMTIALCDAGIDEGDETLLKAVDWIKARQQLGPEGDWRVYRPKLAPGGFSFEYHNSWHPDVDDTAAAILAFLKQDPRSIDSPCVIKAAGWILGMQNSDGGWAAFECGNDKFFLNKIPFSDMDALCDPSTVDVTGRVLEALGLMIKSKREKYGTLGLFERVDLACKNAITYLASIQDTIGPWWGRWGSNYVYGTSNVLCGLAYFATNDSRVPDLVNPAIRWLKSIQNTDGGWGERLESYKNDELAGCGPTTPSQTAWSLMALLAHLPPTDEAIRKGVGLLVSSQIDQETGASWSETYYTGTGFPNWFYLGYSYYRHYFPMMALGRYSRAMKASSSLQL